MKEFKHIAIVMIPAILIFYGADYMVWFGETYNTRSGALHVVFLFFGWLGYITMPTEIKE